MPTSQLEEEMLRQLVEAGMPPPKRQHPVCPARRWRFDFAWPQLMIALEIDGAVYARNGGRHHGGAGYTADCEKLNAAAIEGWLVLRFTAPMVHGGVAREQTRRALAADGFEFDGHGR